MTGERPINEVGKKARNASTTFFGTKISSTHYKMATSDQCALGPDGKLLDASEIVWVHDPDDPISNEPDNPTSRPA
jgi:hypothetical protein